MLETSIYHQIIKVQAQTDLKVKKIHLNAESDKHSPKYKKEFVNIILKGL